MNRLNFNQTGGFPLSTNILDAMQTAYSVFNALGNLAGNLSIISGCEDVGGYIADGVVYIGGEVLEFRGGGLGTSVIIKKDIENRIFENGSSYPVVYKRYATFGSSTPDKTFRWADFKRVFPTTQIEQFRADFEARIKKLESAKFPIPVGMVAIWNKPASEPIPAGWQECTDLRGRVPAGWDPDDDDFNTVGRALGSKTHTLSIHEMPQHSHKVLSNNFGTQVLSTTSSIAAWGDPANNGPDWNYALTAGSGAATHGATSPEGGNQPHNNIQPTRIVRFIEFVGFN